MGINKDIKNNIKVILLIIFTLFILYILHITIGDIFNVQIDDKYESHEITIIFQKDTENKVLTVVEIYPEDNNFYWPDISVVNGSVNIPLNKIDIGDKITNCSNYLKLEYIISGEIIWEGDFN